MGRFRYFYTCHPPYKQRFMAGRLLVLMVLASFSMAATCNKVNCDKLHLDKCDLHMKQIISSPNGEYMAVSSQRICDGMAKTQEVTLYKKGEAMSNACGNVYITIDTATQLSIDWQGDTLSINQAGTNPKAILLKMKKALKLVTVKYQLGK